VSIAIGQIPGLWLRMQASRDLWQLEQQRLPKIERLTAYEKKQKMNGVGPCGTVYFVGRSRKKTPFNR